MSSVFAKQHETSVLGWKTSDNPVNAVIVAETVLDIETSVRGRRWVFRSDNEDLISDYQKQYDLDLITARLLAGREVELELVNDFLDPTLRNLMPDPSSLKDMDKAVSAILDALESDKRIAIFADYDVDGATSAAQLLRWAKALEHEFGLYVPDRIREGYGPSEQAFQILKDQGFDMVITVDCGAAAQSALVSAENLGLDIVVVDHHLMGADLPPCRALVNPNRPDDSSGLGFLAAAGVTFMLLAGLNRELRRRGQDGLPDLFSFLGLTALGTICDVVPLTQLNRAIVRQGLKVLTGQYNPGVAALADVAKIQKPYTTYHAGFVLGPRINAGGRIGEASMGAELLSTEDTQKAYHHAAELDRVNIERKKLQAQILFEADEAATKNMKEDSVVVTAMEGWHAGIIGIVAGRLKDQLSLPVIVIGIDDDGIGKGSGRSLKGVNLGEAISEARKQGLLISGGGHAMAAGLTIEAEKIDEFEAFIQDYLKEDVIRARQEIAMKVDCLVRPTAIGPKLVESLERVGPYGASNPEPVFVLDSLNIAYAERLRGGHIRCAFADREGVRVNAICFNAEENGLAEVLMSKHNKPVHVAGRIKQDNWNGRSKIDFQVVDIAFA